MLTEEVARSLGFKEQFHHKITATAFSLQGDLWQKSKVIDQIPYTLMQKKHTFSYYKKGRVFGLETKRYLEHCEGILLYFQVQDQQDIEYKGYCLTENLYMYYLPIGSQFLLHLTNGKQFSQFYFSDNTFYSQVESKLKKQVVQLNFKQKYNLLELLGKGTFSKVYLGKNKSTNISYAIKIVAKKDKNGSCTKSIVEEEKRIFSILNSHYVCKMEEFFEEDDCFIFVLEYLSGKDLMTFYRENVEISLPVLVGILKRVLESLAYIHSKNIIHRDLKPQNIMINQNTMSPTLIDFGLSLLCNQRTDKKRFKRCGTMGYMAYEVITNSGDKKKIYDSKCDVFSFGIIAHMMLLGYNPLKGKSYVETASKNEECNIQLEKQKIVKKYGFSGFNFLFGLLQKDPTKRLSAIQALGSSFITQEFLSNSKIYNDCDSITEEEKEDDQAQFEEEDEEIKIPSFQIFVAKSINMGNRI